MRVVLRRFSILAIVVTSSACADPQANGAQLGGYAYRTGQAIQYKLPKVLREISGLTIDEQDRLYAHDDERGIIYRIDYVNGQVLSRFGLEGKVKADFEGIATSGDRLFLIDSSGGLYRFAPGDTDEVVPFDYFPQQLDCEIEGLTYAPSARALLAACKNLLVADPSTALEIHLWDIDREAYDPDRTIRVSADRLRAFFESRGMNAPARLQPAGVAMASNGHLVLVAGRQHLLLELSLTGEPVAVMPLESDRHPQTEGIAIDSAGVLILADEGDSTGNKKSRGRLSIHEPDR